MESALFGHKRGSFTGATADLIGFFGLALEGGTLFLDEVGEIPLHVQAKLLRPLHNRAYTPIGESHPRPILGRLIFATHCDLEAMCREGKFRPDLLERMSGYHIHMPSLRHMLAEAPGELRTYVRAFVEQKKLDHPEQNETRIDTVIASIQANRPGHPWPRNLRELKHHTERCLLDEDDPPAPAAPAPASRRAATTPPPSSSSVPSVRGILGPRAKAGEVTLAQVVRAFLTWMYLLAGQNGAEAARRARIDKKTLLRKVDFGLLARWLKRLK
jgi:DNA-binding NtrC family response regulator